MSGVRVRASFQTVGRLGLGFRLAADRADVMFTHSPVKPLLLQTMCVEVFSGVEHDFLYKLDLSACIRRADRRGAL